MKATFEVANGFPVEIVGESECANPTEQKWAILQMWDEEELIDLLCRRMEKSELEIRILLGSYHDHSLTSSLPR